MLGKMDYEKGGMTKPRIVIHGGAGNITRDNLPPKAYNAYRDALKSIVEDSYIKLRLPRASALDVATHAVSLLENNALFNAGHGAVFTAAGTHELEASVMVSRGYRKRGVGIMNVTRAKNPIKVAREMLIRGEEQDGGGAQGHCQLQGAIVDQLTEVWGLETVKSSWYWTRRRWDEHRRGLGKKHDDETYERHKHRADEAVNHSVPGDMYGHAGSSISEDLAISGIGWDGKEYLPQGTVGAVVLDCEGTVCCATSTGGLTNKLPGRVGDTPTLGAGFWAEEWFSMNSFPFETSAPSTSSFAFLDSLSDCIPGLSGYIKLPSLSGSERKAEHRRTTRAVAMSGTGNGDSFLRLAAVRTAAGMARFSNQPDASGRNRHAGVSLQSAVTAVAGPNGMLQQSAEDRWHKTGEGEGGIIGIDVTDGRGEVVFDFNCGGMFHAWIDEQGQARFQVFRDEINS